MMELSIAYLFAGVLIAGLVLLARRNHRQGWRKQRGAWFENQEQAAVRALKSPEELPSAPLRHLADLERLRQALTEHGESRHPEPATAPKEHVTRSR